MASIRVRALSLLVDGPLTATTISERLGVDRSAASHAVARAHAAEAVRIVDYLCTGASLAPVYGLGDGGVDVERPAPLGNGACAAAYRTRHPDRNRASSRAWRERNLEHVLAKQAEYRARRRAAATLESAAVEPVESCSQNAALSVKEIAVPESVPQYFELDVLPGVKHFTCDRYRATLSVQSCSGRWTLANEGAADERQSDRMRSCLKCPVGALHAGKSDRNVSPWKGSMRCARCGELASRLVGRHLCLSDYNRQREALIGKNRKGTRPIKIGELSRRSVSYFTSGAHKVKTIEHTVGLEEVMFSVLRDEMKTVKFGGVNVHPSLAALCANPDLDFSISDDVEARPVADVSDVADSVQDTQEPAAVPLVASVLADVVEPVVDRLQALRDVLERDDRDVPVNTQTVSRGAAKKLLQHARREVRVSNVTVQLLRKVGALPAPAPVVAPAPQTFYSASMFSD